MDKKDFKKDFKKETMINFVLEVMENHFEETKEPFNVSAMANYLGWL